MAKFTVPVVVEINGFIEVEADDAHQARVKAMDEYDRRMKKNFKKKDVRLGDVAAKMFDAPAIYVEFADEEDCEDDEEDDGSEF